MKYLMKYLRIGALELEVVASPIATECVQLS